MCSSLMRTERHLQRRELAWQNARRLAEAQRLPPAPWTLPRRSCAHDSPASTSQSHHDPPFPRLRHHSDVRTLPCLPRPRHVHVRLTPSLLSNALVHAVGSVLGGRTSVWVPSRVPGGGSVGDSRREPRAIDLLAPEPRTMYDRRTIFELSHCPARKLVLAAVRSAAHMTGFSCPHPSVHPRCRRK